MTKWPPRSDAESNPSVGRGLVVIEMFVNDTDGEMEIYWWQISILLKKILLQNVHEQSHVEI